MDITVSNFSELLPMMIKSIETADFIALDTEFSGLSIGFEDQTHGFDQAEQRYQKLKHCVDRCNAFQIGWTTYKWDENQSCYVSRPFNAYVWPHSDILGDRVNQFKSSNIKFLMQHNFDFNKLFKEGINYQRLSDEALVRQKIDLRPEYDIVKSVTCTNTNQGIRYNSQRAYTSIGSTS